MEVHGAQRLPTGSNDPHFPAHILKNVLRVPLNALLTEK